MKKDRTIVKPRLSLDTELIADLSVEEAAMTRVNGGAAAVRTTSGGIAGVHLSC